MMEFEIAQEQRPEEGKLMHMYQWSASPTYPRNYLHTHISAHDDGKTVSKVTLDIICDTAFGYKSNSLRDPHNELTEAYHNLLELENGKISFILPIFSLILIPRSDLVWYGAVWNAVRLIRRPEYLDVHGARVYPRHAMVLELAMGVQIQEPILTPQSHRCASSVLATLVTLT